ncbi:arsenic resistance protein [Microbacterium sp. NPDC091313]
MGSAHGWADRHQVALYIAAIAVGALIGGAAPMAAPVLGVAATPVLALLLFVTFLGVPVLRIGGALRDARFVAAVLVTNFVVAPLVAAALGRLVAADTALLVGVLLVLLTPCVDYVIVFAGLAGGDARRLLALTPVLMILQLLTLPLWLWLFAGADAVATIDPVPFVEAFVVLIAIPWAAAAVLQALAARRAGPQRVVRAASSTMVPLMMLTLFAVVASQVARVGAAWPSLLPVVPLFVAFAVVMAGAGALVALIARLPAASRVAVVFSGVTRNSLVVLPLALALPPAFATAPLVVVTQTLVELVLLVAVVAVVRRSGRLLQTPR